MFLRRRAWRITDVAPRTNRCRRSRCPILVIRLSLTVVARPSRLREVSGQSTPRSHAPGRSSPSPVRRRAPPSRRPLPPPESSSAAATPRPPSRSTASACRPRRAARSVIDPVKQHASRGHDQLRERFGALRERHIQLLDIGHTTRRDQTELRKVSNEPISTR